MSRPLEERLLDAAGTLLLDATAVRVVAHLRDHGIGCVLVKGPSISTWLYQPGERRYVDIDLLVDPLRYAEAAMVLARLGFMAGLRDASPEERGDDWQNEQALRRADGVEVDLHRRLIGVPDAERCWQVLSRLTVPLELPGGRVPVLAPEARALHLALHLAQNGLRDRQAAEDLRRGVTVLPHPVWVGAARTAAELGAERALGAGLRLLPEGSRLAAALDLSDELDVELAVRIRGRSQDALFFERLRAVPWGARARLVLREVWPTRAFLCSSLPWARRGPGFLLVARAVRLASVGARLPGALAVWAGARSSARPRGARARPPGPPCAW